MGWQRTPGMHDRGGMQVMEIKVPTVGGLVSDWFQNTLPAALEREASRVRVT